MSDRKNLQPLTGVKIVEFEGIGPAPLAGLMLMQMGAEITLIERPGGNALPDDLKVSRDTLLTRGKLLVALNFNRPDYLYQDFKMI